MAREVSDIVHHEFSDAQWELNTLSPQEGVELSLYRPEPDNEDGDEATINLSKEDVAALARHYGLLPAVTM
ncbi:MAG: hypothetical protein GY833_21995 [Aestuariibacter sp.]|nr:hypothetical protein [Aestuariibacter sp.]